MCVAFPWCESQNVAGRCKGRNGSADRHTAYVFTGAMCVSFFSVVAASSFQASCRLWQASFVSVLMP